MRPTFGWSHHWEKSAVGASVLMLLGLMPALAYAQSSFFQGTSG